MMNLPGEEHYFMRIQVIGAGSLGLLLAGKLAFAGCNVMLTARSERQRDAIRRKGIAISGLTELAVSDLRIDTFEEVSSDLAPDWIFLTVKQTQLDKELIDGVADRLKSHSRLVLFQNGIGHEDRFAGAVSQEQLYLAVTTEGAKRLNDTEVSHTGIGETWIGLAGSSGTHESDGNHFTNGEKKLQKVLTKAGFQFFLSNDMNSRVWEKLIINAVINPLTTVLRLRNGELPETAERLCLMRRLYDEALELAACEQVLLAPDLWERVLNVCSRTALNHSSMLQDVAAGRATEIDAITGSVLRIGERHALKLTTHLTLYELVKGLKPVSQSKADRSEFH